MNLLEPYVGKKVTAQSASKDLDIQTILTGCDNVENALSDLSTISMNFYESGSTINEKSLSADGVTFVNNITNCCSEITTSASTITSALSQIRESAVSQYNKLQQQYNDEAKIKDRSGE